MNADFALVNRALMNIGLKRITEDDRKNGTEAWLTARDYYLQTMLEALAQVEWTSAKRRRELAPSRKPYKGHADFSCMYDLPIDCAKAIELDGQEYFEVENSLLFTNVSPARLLYVSNGRYFSDQSSLRKIIELNGERRYALSGGTASRKPGFEYLNGGDGNRDRRREAEDNTVWGGTGSRQPAPDPEEDFPDYLEMKLEPNFYQYWECLLSSKYALRLTDKPDLSVSYFNKAMAIGKAAEAVSIVASAAKRQAPDSWQDQMGLGEG